jgi:N-acetylglucosaminyl-diphospho-decaprenol L-rhamnosyltransferase
MKLSVIIVNWNSLSYLQACLLTLYRETRGISFGVIVVDNGSRGGCRSILQQFPTVDLIEAGENLGFARANNRGYGRSNGEYILFLNPDTEIIGDALAKMVTYLHLHPKVGAVGARLLNSDRSLQTSCVQAFPTLWNQFLDADVLRRLFPSWRVWGTRALFDEQTREADFVSGACVMVKRSVFDQVGGFGEEYFMYGDDLDLSYKIRQAGYLVHCLNDCEVIHHGGKSSAQQSDGFSEVFQRESLTLFFLKTRGAWYCAAYRVATTAVSLIRLGLVACLIPFASVGLLQRKQPRLVFRKWSRILGWALGFKGSLRNQGSPANV